MGRGGTYEIRRQEEEDCQRARGRETQDTKAGGSAGLDREAKGREREGRIEKGGVEGRQKESAGCVSGEKKGRGR